MSPSLILEPPRFVPFLFKHKLGIYLGSVSVT